MWDKLFLQNKKTDRILNNIRKNKVIKVSGLTGSRLAFFMGNIFSELNKKNYLLLTAERASANQHYEDLIRMLDKKQVLMFPEIEVLPHEQIVPDFHVRQERIKVMQECLFGNYKKVIITPVAAFLRYLMPAKIFRKYAISYTVGQEIKLDKLKKRLNLLGYEREDMVEEPQQFSVRGGIVDIFTLGEDKPFRIELFGDEIDSLRKFNLSTQRSTEEIEKVVIPPAEEIILLPEEINEKIPVIRKDYQQAIQRLENVDQSREAEYLAEKKTNVLEQLNEFNKFPGYAQFLPYFFPELSSLMDYLGKSSSVFIEHFPRVQERVENFSRDIRETVATLLEQGSILPNYNQNFINDNDFTEIISGANTAYFTEEFYNLPIEQKAEEVKFSTTGVEPFHSQLELFAERLKELLTMGYKIIITLNSEGKVERIKQFLREKELPVIDSSTAFRRGKIIFQDGSFAEGFKVEDLKLAVFTEQDVIGNPQKTRKTLTNLEEGVKISSLNELEVGDYVVHENHGIGKYLGVKSLEVKDQHHDYLVLKYANDDKLYVPTDKVDLVQKYVGASGRPPSLYELGGNKWQRVKQKVQDSVKEMAVELLELYAERETVEGYSYSEDSEIQEKFDRAFPYEETPDQLKAIQDVKADMEASTPMDRLLCGDVGYGKTEVAIRAAFKAALDGKQTAVLVPTTILAQQHFNTFRERLDGFPVMVDMISRFRTPKEQKEILKKVGRGEIDIIIGTHRLLSGDIIFNDLGLLIIDEEQRFGVSHKERIKDLKRNLDVLTLTATPIPRTLHMALAGVRDMSVIETPPENRYPIRTYIREFNEELIKDAIRKEMGRDGQIYFVHNRVKDIDEKADMIRKLVPEADIAVAHGQMNENRLENLMHDFYNHKFDVLVCTTIIETGLDIPNVNTIIINRAEQMGLAQLYQLRGRVGRTNRIAYAYLVYKKDKVLPEVAEKRLKAIKEFTNLGSGFKIAMRDLEIRGAGNLLGPEQHGHIASIGFSLYCKLLEGAVEELKGKKEEKKDIEVDLKLDAYIPKSYIPDSRQKIEVYNKIENIRTESGIQDMIDELKDRFGELPPAVKNLLKIRRIRVKARKIGVEKIIAEKNLINIYFESMQVFSGTNVMDLVEKYSRKIKIRSGNKPIIGIKKKQGLSLDFLITIIESLSEMMVVKA